jgi:hypothetical protein
VYKVREIELCSVEFCLFWCKEFNKNEFHKGMMTTARNHSEKSLWSQKCELIEVNLYAITRLLLFLHRS